MRVIAGELKSRRLVRPPEGVRPTADRVREALFARLGDLCDARVLDLYAGTGSLAIESLSRGAADAVLVEKSPRALAVIRENLERLGLTGRSRVLRGDATTWLVRLGRSGDRFDLIFVDPPYASDEAARALAAIVASGVLARGGAVIVETAKGETAKGETAKGATAKGESGERSASIEGLREDGSWLYGDTRVARWVS